jgi:hypothetical protein
MGVIGTLSEKISDESEVAFIKLKEHLKIQKFE